MLEDIKNTVIHGKSEDVLKDLPDNCIDTIITDPPYGLSFMGKKWDYQVPDVEVWQECLRVLKPGGTLLCFAGTRTQHRMAVNVEDAGFILKDVIMWLYGSGFPKATDISKQLDKGHERKVVGTGTAGKGFNKVKGFGENTTKGGEATTEWDVTEPVTDEAKLWDGWKSHGLKPAYEPILVAMKANEGSYANNALVRGVSGLNIDAARIPFESEADKKSAVFGRGTDILGGNYVGGEHGTGETNILPDDKGRFPANVILDKEAGEMLDEQTGLVGGDARESKSTYDKGAWGNMDAVSSNALYNDKGGASRFFYCAKASKAEKNAGLVGMAEKIKDPEYRQPTGNAMVDRIHGCGKKLKNHHPTVKPLDLMEYLCKLTSTPTGGIVLDPFCGSGSTCKAAYNVGREYIGIDREVEYCEIARKRIAESDQILSDEEVENGQQGLFE